jgi:hypothetical protein
MQADSSVPGNNPAQYMLIEGNTVFNMVGESHALGLFQAESCGGQCFNAIVRFHVAAHFGGGGIVDDNSGAIPPPQAWINVKAYNNTWVDGNNQTTGVGNGTNGFDHGSFGGSEINDLFYYPESLADFNPYECQTNNGNSCSSFTYGHNLAWCTGGTCNLRSHLYGTGAFTDDPGNIKANPSLVNYGAGDFHLAAGSPAIGAGTSLTTTVGAGTSSTALIVADAAYFQDGSGITGVQADWIRIGASTTVQISSINYSTRVITLAGPASWTSGAPIYLYKDSNGTVVLNGANPDIGAY